MSDNAVSTQAGIGTLKTVLAAVSDNLSEHVNTSLSKAHGVNMATGPSNDGNGNDLSTYQDSNGDLVADKFARFTVNNTVYYAPAQLTALPGKSATNGVEVRSATAEGVDTSAWITDYVTQSGTDLYTAEDTFLKPHVLKGHWETHAEITAVNENTLDSAGHVVGTTSLNVVVGERVYKIPSSSRIGGPVQPPRGWGIDPDTLMKVRKDDWKRFTLNRVDGNAGTLPISFQWQVQAGTSERYEYVPDAVPPLPPLPPPLPGDWVNVSNVGQTLVSNSSRSLYCTLDSLKRTMFVDVNTVFNEYFHIGWVRVAYSNPGGTVYTVAVELWAADKDSAICTVVIPKTPDNAFLWRTLDALFMHAESARPDMTRTYVGIGSKLARCVKQAPETYRAGLKARIERIAETYLSGNLVKAMDDYTLLVADVIQDRWPQGPLAEVKALIRPERR